MADRNFTVWTCDRCGYHVETDLGKQPDFWGRMEVYMPPKQSHDGGPDRSRVLCGGCLERCVSVLLEAERVAAGGEGNG